MSIFWPFRINYYYKMTKKVPNMIWYFEKILAAAKSLNMLYAIAYATIT